MSLFMPGLVGFIVVIRFLVPLPWSRYSKVAMATVIMVISLHHLWSQLAFGSRFSPEVPREVMIAVNWVVSSILLLIIFQIILDIFAMLTALVRRRRVGIPVSVRYTMAICALILAAIGVTQAIGLPPVKQVEIEIAGLPRELDGYRIVQLTDLHISRLFEAPWVETVVRDTNSLNPDLIVTTGDLIDGTIDARRRDTEPLKDLIAVDGVFAIPGNHEYYYGHPEWMRRFGELGITTISNGHVILRRGDTSFATAGVNDPAAASVGLPGPHVEQAIGGIQEGIPIIMLDHQPKNAALAARAGVALRLSGHTHGGQIIGLHRLIQLFNNGYVSGLYDVEGMPLYVSNGTGLWVGFAIRLGIPSELTTIVLRSG
ncbi:metallophosphoesterase [Mesorhizobium sp. 2RAF21]|uniref:metallophosphoesterase n=1 Tax=Mesorhizobium sp. 2RAF21 TaxID=3232995 RepID=UPI003F96F5A4